MKSFATLIIFACATWPAHARAETHRGPVADSATVGPYRIRVMGSDVEKKQWAEVVRDGHRVLGPIRGFRMRIGGYWPNEDGGIESGTDVNADGIPDVTLWDWAGGAHCCFTTTIVSLGDSAWVLGRFPTGNWAARLVNLDDDTALEIETQEDAFAWWHGSFGATPAPRVVLEWNGSRYAASPELTFRPVDEDSVLALADSLHHESSIPHTHYFSAEIPVMNSVVDLMYAGHLDLALRFLERATTSETRSRFDFLMIELGEHLQASPYWKDLAKEFEAGAPPWR